MSARSAVTTTDGSTWLGDGVEDRVGRVTRR
jgi:hypothetical protein